MKKFVFTLIVMLGICQLSIAQLNLCIYKKDGSVVKFLASNVSSIVFNKEDINTIPQEEKIPEAAVKVEAYEVAKQINVDLADDEKYIVASDVTKNTGDEIYIYVGDETEGNSPDKIIAAEDLSSAHDYILVVDDSDYDEIIEIVNTESDEIYELK